MKISPAKIYDKIKETTKVHESILSNRKSVADPTRAECIKGRQWNAHTATARLADALACVTSKMQKDSSKPAPIRRTKTIPSNIPQALQMVRLPRQVPIEKSKYCPVSTNSTIKERKIGKMMTSLVFIREAKCSCVQRRCL